jgi:hypothetical protein
MRKGSFFSFEFRSFEFFERTKFKRTINQGLYSHKRIFSFETNFKRTTDEFLKNVIRSNDLLRYDKVIRQCNKNVNIKWFKIITSKNYQFDNIQAFTSAGSADQW